MCNFCEEISKLDKSDYPCIIKGWDSKKEKIRFFTLLYCPECGTKLDKNERHME